MKQGHGRLAAEYAAAQREMDKLSDGAHLRAAAADVLEQLPPGPLVLAAASLAGAGLAAACAALRPEPTTWTRVTLTHPQTLPGSGRVVFVEPIAPDAGWLTAMERWFPNGELVVPSGTPQPALAA